MNLSPVVLFVYNRPWHTEQTLMALEKNYLSPESELIIYADGLKQNEEEVSIKHHKLVDEIISRPWHFKSISITRRDGNLGLANNLISGITEVVNVYGRVIVLEDDLVTSPYFLTYCNEGLELYESEKNVYSINGFQFPLGIDVFDTFLCPLATSSWGWATWADRWSCFQKEASFKKIIQESSFIRSRFNFADYDYASMLENKKSWAILWYYSVFLRNGLGLFPTVSLVQNIGFDGTGENCSETVMDIDLIDNYNSLSKSSEIDILTYSKFLDYFSKKSGQVKKNKFKLNYIVTYLISSMKKIIIRKEK